MLCQQIGPAPLRSACYQGMCRAATHQRHSCQLQATNRCGCAALSSLHVSGKPSAGCHLPGAEARLAVAASCCTACGSAAAGPSPVAGLAACCWGGSCGRCWSGAPKGLMPVAPPRQEGAGCPVAAGAAPAGCGRWLLSSTAPLLPLPLLPLCSVSCKPATAAGAGAGAETPSKGGTLRAGGAAARTREYHQSALFMFRTTADASCAVMSMYKNDSVKTLCMKYQATMFDRLTWFSGAGVCRLAAVLGDDRAEPRDALQRRRRRRPPCTVIGGDRSRRSLRHHVLAAVAALRHGRHPP